MNKNDYAANAYKKNLNQKSSTGNSDGKQDSSEFKAFSPQGFTKINLGQSSFLGNSGSVISSGTSPSPSNNGSQKVESVSKEIRRTSEPGKEPLVHKAVFRKLNSQIDEMFKNNEAQKEAEKQAELAAKTGSWFGKKAQATEEDVWEAAQKLKQGGLIKVPYPENNPPEKQKDSIYRRVAKFLVVIGVDEAAKVLPHLTQEQTEKIIPEIASIRSVSPEEAEQVIQEFQALIQKSREDGGVETARNILTKAYGSQKAEEVLSKSVKYSNGKPFDYLADANPERIQLLLTGESLQVQALVLSQLEPKKAAGVINRMDVEQKKQIVLRLAKMKSVAPEVLNEISKSLHEKLLTQNTESSNNMDGRGVLAQILKKMTPGSETAILNTLSDENPELGADLRRRLFTEEDVVNCDDRFLQNKLQLMENETIALIIRGKNEDFRQKLLSNVSKTRGDIILEEESMKVQVLKSDVEKATSIFFAELRRAWENGELRIKGRDEDEVYV